LFWLQKQKEMFRHFAYFLFHFYVAIQLHPHSETDLLLV